MSFWEKLKQNAREYEELKKQVDDAKREFADEVNNVFKNMETKRRNELGELANKTFDAHRENLIDYCKSNLRIGEFEAEEVAIFYYSLSDENRTDFLTYFSEEEKEVINYQFNSLRHYTERVIKDLLTQLKQKLEDIKA